MDITFRQASKRDRIEFSGAWLVYLQERARAGSIIAPTSKNLAYYLALFDQIMLGHPGICIVAIAGGHVAGAGLYGPEMPLEATKGRRICLGNGTFVHEAFRGKKISRGIYEEAFPRLKAQGFTHITGSVDVDNEVGVASVLARHMDATSINFLKAL